jgi:tetratricopeptide (TPR) repeat protein
VIARKDGSNIECSEPFVIINDSYVCRGPDGKDRSVPASDVDKEKTAAANRALTEAAAPPAPLTPALDPGDTYSDLLRLRRMLRTHQVLELTRVLESRQAALEKDFRQEAASVDTYGALASEFNYSEAQFNDWVRQAPGSWVPYLVRGAYYDRRGWRARGGEWARETTGGQFENMERFFRKAMSDLKAALAINPRLVVAYYNLIKMTKAENGEEDRAREYLDGALAICPACLEVRWIYIFGLRPRWGGSYPEMRAAADEALQSLHLNPLLSSLQGAPDWDAGIDAREGEQYGEAVQFYTKAISYGDYWNYYEARGLALRYQRRYNEALADLERAIALRPGVGVSYLERAVCRGYLGDLKGAWRDIDTARVLSTSDGRLASTEKWLAGWAPRGSVR